MLVTLFDTARAVDVTFVDPPSSFSDTATFTFDVKIPNGQRIPIISVESIIEKKNANYPDKAGALVKGRATCPMHVQPPMDCPTTHTYLERLGTVGSAITSMKFLNAYTNTVSADTAITGSGYFGTGTLTATTTGYGYDTISSQYAATGGYGYGYDFGTRSTVTDGAGSGYGYSGSDLILRFQVTLSGTTINSVEGTGTYYLTILARTGSLVLGDFSSKFTEFAIVAGGGGGSSGTGTATGTATATATATSAPLPSGTAPGEQQTVTATQSTTPPPGATVAYTATIATASAQNTVVVDLPDNEFLQELTLTMSQAVTNAQVTIAIFPATAPPTGTNAPPIVVGYYVTITISSGDPVTSAKMKARISGTDVPNGGQGRAVVLKFDEATNTWTAQSRIPLTAVGQNFEGEATVDCCSTFSIGFDMTPPDVSLTMPAGVLTGANRFTAAATDNLKVTKVEFLVDGVVKLTDSVEPFEFDFNTETLTNGEHRFSAKAYDFVDATDEDAKTAQVQNDSPAPPPTDEGGGGGISSTVWIIIGLVVIGLIIAAFVLAGKKPGGGKTGGT